MAADEQVYLAVHRIREDGKEEEVDQETAHN